MNGGFDGVRRCFQPRQWFVHGKGEPRVGQDEFFNEDVLVWVYKKLEDGRFQVGYYMPNGEWFADSTHDTRELAVERVRYLQGR